jgi:hypothetical protein
MNPSLILILLALFFAIFILPKIISQRGSNANHSEGKSTLTDQKLGMTLFGGSGREKLRVFESKMEEGGFTKRIVVFFFFSENDKRMNKTDNLHQWAVGIWLNYQKQLVSLRLDGNSSNEIFIPFDKFQSVEIIEDGFTKSTENFFGTAVNSRGYSTGLQVRIVIGDINSGITPYILKLYDPTVGQGPGGVPSRLDKSSSKYRSLVECAKSINDEIAFIMNNSK